MASAQLDLAILAAVVRQVGGESSQVAHVLELFRHRLIADGQQPVQTLYVYRSAGSAERSSALLALMQYRLPGHGCCSRFLAPTLLSVLPNAPGCHAHRGC